MSVQAGIWHLDGSPVNCEFLTQVSQNLAEYGPDGEETYTDRSLGMVYRPFHTTGEDRLEHQPYQSAGGNVITWDGRLDNRDELMAHLRETLNGDKTDVGIVAAAFDRWGTNCFAKLTGDWAIAIWNPGGQQLVLARDYIGIRHLFYYPKNSLIAWCSHLSALALCGDRFTLCPDYIAGYLAFYADAHLTPYSEIHAVPPGKFVSIRNKHIAVHSYWSFDTERKIRYKADSEYAEQYRELFRQAIRRRLRTNSPVLAELSGGFDSSSVVCMADDIIAKDHMQTVHIDTLSFHDSTEPEEDDLFYFTKVEHARNKVGFHIDLRASGDSFVIDHPTFVATPGSDCRAEVRSALLPIVKSHGYRVLLSGHGGDQINGQSLDPRILMADLLLRLRLVAFGRQLMNWSLLIRKRPAIQLFLQTLLHLIPVQIRAQFTGHAEKVPWVDRKFAKKYRVSARLLEVVDGVWFSRPSARDAMQTIGTLSRYLSNSIPSVIEKRYPYLDQDFVEFMTAIPLDQLLRPGQRRLLMRRALADILPPEVLNRKVKARVGRYPCIVMEKHWARLEAALSSFESVRLGYVSRDDIQEALFALKNGRLPTYVLRLVNAVSLEFWLRDARDRGVISLENALLRP